MIYGTDYHMHTLYSDGKREPEAYIEAAIRAGLREVGFSEHLNPLGRDRDWCIDHDRLPAYAEHIMRLKTEYKEQIAVRLGLEIDYLPGTEKDTERIIDSFPFDFIIGSVHYLGDETVDLGPQFYIGRDVDNIYENYFNLVCEAASTGFFDIMGHPDLVRIFRFYPQADISLLYSMMASSFSIHDVAFELNTNGRNKPLRDFYPDKQYLHLFAQQGVAVCVNSDAHFPERVGQYFREAYDLLKRAGFREMAAFSGRERFMIPF